MLTVNQLTKRYGDVTIFQNVSFTVNPGERVGLVGPNGCGKTTLLRMVTGEVAPTAGSVALVPGDLRVGYLPQGLEPAPGETLHDFLYPQLRELAALEAALEQHALAMAESPGDPAVWDAYSKTLARIERLSRAYQPGSAEAVLAGLDLADVAPDTPAGILSGGQKTRLSLARVLLGGPELLLLDEPTNHLDIGALEWLEVWLAGFPGAALIVSHDRTFLDRTVNRVVAFDPETLSASSYTGNYTDYVAAVIKARDKQWAEYRDQVVEIARLRRDARQTMANAQHAERDSTSDSARRLAKKAAKKAKAKEKRLERYLERADLVEKPGCSWQMKLVFEDLPAGGRDVLHLERLAVGYAPGAPLLGDINLTLRAGERIALLGPNGCGKSTLLRTIMGEIAPLAGRVRAGANIHIGYQAQEQETLDPEANALAALLAVAAMSHTEARKFLHYFLFAGDEVFTPVAALSYGERARLMLALMVARGCNLLVLDEPINHLDVPARERFEQAMAAYEGTVLAVVHDRYFVDRFATGIWVAEGGTVTRYIDRAEYQKVRAVTDVIL
ncbi:MAG: ABC-F family ATP-binding cassette domain-containing protein [Anaerolineae bacterium]|nr:ABC-F family ATP-binding cassette domain-containing protein [Anaerolineae bacterium]